MKKILYFIFFFFTLIITACKNDSREDQQEVAAEPAQSPVASENSEPWTEQQLLEPRVLAHEIENDQDSLVIFSLGAGNIIPGSKDTGPAGEDKALENLKKELEALPRDTDIVIYCGCCPIKICPNVRPAFSLLNEMGFTNHELLNLQENIKVDWIDKGYPTGS